MTIAFIRTYNNKQNSEVQEAVIREFAESQKIEIGKWAKEVGNSPRANRRLESIVKSLSPGDEILVSDISRVSRKMIEIIHIILLCIERKVTLRSVSDGYVFEDNIDSKTLAFTFGLVSEIERKLVSIRTKEALALIRSKGVVLGRPKGSQQMGRLEPYKEQIEKDLKDPSLTYAQIAEKYNVSLSSFKRFLKERYQDTIIKATGFSVVFLGAAGTLSKILTVRPDGTLSTGGSMVMILSLALGALLGELSDLDAQFERFGEWLKHKTGSDGDFMNRNLTRSVIV